MIVPIILFLLFLTLAFIYLSGRYNENYWKKRGVVYHTRNKFVGPTWEFLTKGRAFFEVLHTIYKDYPDEPAVGIGSLLTPAIYVRDPQNVQHVLQSDFNSFSHRGFEPVEGDKLSQNILFMNGNEWKLVRQKMTPLFTAAKLKNMYYIIDKSAQDFVEFLKKNPEKQKENAFDTLSMFCSAAIAAAVFGISTKSIFDSPFLKMARDAVAPNFSVNLKFSINNVFPAALRAFGLKIFSQFEKFFTGAISQVIEQRERENVKKHDFADICVALQKNGKLRDPDTGLEIEPSNELFAAQAFFFFIAGVEPCATGLLGTLIELGRNPIYLQQAHQEVDEAFGKHDGKLTYEIVNDMEYLEKALSEGLRMYPPIGFLTRKCVQNSVLPVGNIKIDKGTKIITPIYEIHHDPKYYPNPEVYDPERFSREAKQNTADAAYYMPFGKGNRLCIGMRYAQLQVKAGLIHILRHFTIKTVVAKDGIKFNKETVQVRPINVNVEFIPRDMNT